MMRDLAPASESNYRMSFPIDFLLPATPRGLLAGAVLLLTGCTALPPVPEPKPAAPTPAAVPAAVVVPAAAAAPTPPPPSPSAPTPAPDTTQAEFDAMSRRLLAFHERLRDLGPADLGREVARLGEPTEPATRMELALVLAQTRQNGDLARALALVEPLARASPAGPAQRFARLLQARLAEQRRLEEQIDRQNQQLRDQQRRLDQLTSQIEALRAIERSLSTRPAAPPAASSAPGATPR